MIWVDVAGDAAVAEAFNRSGSTIRERLKRVVRQEGDQLRSEVQARLSGPASPRRRDGMLSVGATVASRTGKLRASVIAKAFEMEQTFSVRVYPTASNRGFRYGFALGTGFRRQEIDVSGYTQRVESRDRMASAHASRMGRVRARLSSQGVKIVGPYKRSHELVRRPFTTSVLLSRREQITSHLQGEVNQAAVEIQAQLNGIMPGEGI